MFATLADYLPTGAVGDSLPVELVDGATVGSVLRFLNIPAGIDYLTVVNGLDAPAEQTLRDGDVLSLFPPLAGGE
jgi:molybdopterin converting factor small subunit